MSTPTIQELKDFIDSKKVNFEGYSEYPVQGLEDIFYKLAESLNAKKEGYRFLKSVVYAEQFSDTETIDIQASQSKVILKDNVDFSALTIERISAGKYRVTTGYDNELIANLKDNGTIKIQPFQDLSSNNSLRSGDSLFVRSDVSISTKVVFISVGVFDIHLTASKGTSNELAVDCAFYLTIQLFNMPIV